jgi:hypothetical protein
MTTYEGDPVLLSKPGGIVMQISLVHKRRNQTDPLGFVKKDTVER